MWKVAAVTLFFMAFTTLIVTEVLRSVVHGIRQRRDGYGGTQDIAMWGTFVAWFFLIAAIACGVVWLFAR